MNDWLVREALSNVRRLAEVMHRLSDEELSHLITIEEAAQRRVKFLEKLLREQRVRARNAALSNLTKE